MSAVCDTVGVGDMPLADMAAWIADWRQAPSDVVVDIRGPDTDRRPLRTIVQRIGLRYGTMDCGARAGRAFPPHLPTDTAFQRDVARLRVGLATARLLLIGAARDPLCCVRGLWLAHTLTATDASLVLRHAMGGIWESHPVAMERLLVESGDAGPDLFEPLATRLPAALTARWSALDRATREATPSRA